MERLRDGDRGKNRKSLVLEKSVSMMNGIGLIVGTVIGSGIFISPTGILIQTESVGLSLVVWLGCGVLALCGSLCYVELGTTITKSGGEYAYLMEAFGAIPAFLFTWTAVLMIRPSACALVAIIFAEYVAKPFYPDCTPPQDAVKLLACTCLVVVAAVNCWSVKAATRLQDILTYMKLICILMLVIIGIVELCRGKLEHLQNSFEGSNTNIGDIGLAFYLGLWAYDGWNSMNYATEEIKHPEKDLPRAVIFGISMITICYLLVNVAYITVLGPNGILESEAVALSVGNSYLGTMKWVIPLFVAASTFGSVNGTAFMSGRLLYVAAREGHMPALLGMIQVKRLTPLPALLFTTLIAIVMLIPEESSFVTLVDFFSFASWFFYGSTFAALLWLRRKRPNMHRPYRVWLVIPIFMSLASLYLIIAPITSQPLGSLVALGIILAGLPFYLISKRAPQCYLKQVDRLTFWSQKAFDLAFEDPGPLL